MKQLHCGDFLSILDKVSLKRGFKAEREYENQVSSRTSFRKTSVMLHCRLWGHQLALTSERQLQYSKDKYGLG